MSETAEFNYYWNSEHPLKPYTVCQQANKGSIAPKNATRTPPPEATESKWPIWTGTAWALIDDHRGEKGYVDGQSFEIKDFGPYPDGWSEEPPEPTEAELKERRRAEILWSLDRLDNKSMRSVRFIEVTKRALETAVQADKTALETALDDEENRLADYEAQVVELRAELAAMEVKNA